MHRTFVRLLFTIVSCLLPITVGWSQETSEPQVRAEGRLVGRIWHTKVQFEKGFEFLNSVRDELEIPQSPVMVMMSPPGVSLGPGAIRGTKQPMVIEMKGTLFFLQTKPEVSLNNPISFQLVGSLEEFQRLVREQGSLMGPAAEVLGEDDRFEVKLDFSKLLAQSAPAVASEDSSEDAPKVRQTFSIVVTSRVEAGKSEDSKDDGSPPMPPASMSTFYRYVDGIMYSSRTSALQTILLPNQESLKLSDEDASHDLYADFDFTEVPNELKRIFWTALETQASVWLQRFDNEALGDYSLRRAMSEGRLELVKTALFDVDRVQFSLNLASEQTEPITSRLRIRARRNSPLAEMLGTIGNNRSQLAILQDQQSPLVVSGTLNLPQLMRPFAAAFVNSISLKIKEAASETPGAEILIDDLMTPLQSSADIGLLDSAFCLRGNVESGLIPCGGIRMENAEQFLSALEPLLQITFPADKLRVTREQVGDDRILNISADSAVVPIAGSAVPVQLHLTARGSWLWFTIGDERATQVLHELTMTSEDAPEPSGQATPFLIRFQLSKWMGMTDDALSRIPQQVVVELEKWLGRVTAPKMAVRINGSDVKQNSETEESFTSYAAKLFKPDNSDFELKVRTADEEMVVDARLGTSLVKFAVAQFVESQSRMFKNMKVDFAPLGKDGVRSSTISIGVGGSKGK
jgi:hypothetical protein